MNVDRIDSNSESLDTDSVSTNEDEVDIHLNHYRVPKLVDFSQFQIHHARNVYGPPSNGRREISSLTELATQKVACHIPFGLVERFDPPVPEPMQCRIAFWSFPQDEEDVKLYTCLANGNSDVFGRAEEALYLNCVCDMLQVGYHLSANVKPTHVLEEHEPFRVAITFDRRRITSCSCSCSTTTFWCEHAVAVCLNRIRKPNEVALRAPVSESLQRLEKNQLQKFAQYLINELPQQILPAAQKLLDELLSGDEAIINQNPAAPDPTAGATVNEQTKWCLDVTHLSVDVRKILNRQCATQTTVCCDVQSLHKSAPHSVNEYSQLLRTIRGREPEGIWNLITIVGEMMKRRDSNFFLILEILTKEILTYEKIATWWLETSISLYSGSTTNLMVKSTVQPPAPYSCSYFCEQIVHLWRLAAMNPKASVSERRQLHQKFSDWHINLIKTAESGLNQLYLARIVKQNKRNIWDLFPGFKPAIEGCLLNWDDWDRKRNQLVQPEPEPTSTVEKTKTSKSSRRKKKRTKAQKAMNQSEAESKLSVSDDVASNLPGSDDHSESVQNEQSEENIVDGIEPELADGISQDENDQAPNEVSGSNHSSADDVGQEHWRRNSSESGQEADNPDRYVEPELQVYFMIPDQGLDLQEVERSEPTLEELIKVNAIKLNDPLETMYAKAESLFSHGYIREARKLSLRVANEILTYPKYPNLRQLCTLPRRRKKKGSLDNRMSIVTSEALTKIAFLCNVLLSCPLQRNLVFRLALFGVEMKRTPAATKHLEVKLINQKQDLINLLKKITLQGEELDLLREKAQSLIDGQYIENTDALTTLMLGKFIFEALVASRGPCPACFARQTSLEATLRLNQNYDSTTQDEERYLNHYEHQILSQHICEAQRPLQGSMVVQGKLISDSIIGFQASLSALSAKVNFVEADHPLLSEGTRRHRCEFALTLMTHYKDEDSKLDLILKHLLDSDAIVTTPPASDISVASENFKAPVRKTSLPIEPTRASAHVLFELAETVFDKAGGNSTTTHLFRPRLNRAIHRGLHLCSLRIALYSLGLNNRISPTWLQRTYNRRASFINEQALDIGMPAIRFLCDNWEGNLTPVEVAQIADKASCSDDPEMKSVGAELAKSCFRYVYMLGVTDVQRLLNICKDQSSEMVEDACNEIERVAENGNVCATVLFATARVWYDLYMALIREENQCSNGCCPFENALPQSPGPRDVSSWLAFSTTNHERCQHFYNPIHWDRNSIAPEEYMPTYKHVEYVKAAYRVGLKALNALKPPITSSKHNPFKEDDLLWMLGLSKLLGREHLSQFCHSAMKNVTNPHQLHSIVLDLLIFFRKLYYDHPDRMNMLLPLAYRCMERFVKKVDEVMKHYSNEQQEYIEAIIEAGKHLANQTHSYSTYILFERLLGIITKKMAKFKVREEKKGKDREERKGKEIREIRNAYAHSNWVADRKRAMERCPCTECSFGRRACKEMSPEPIRR